MPCRVRYGWILDRFQLVSPLFFWSIYVALEFPIKPHPNFNFLGSDKVLNSLKNLTMDETASTKIASSPETTLSAGTKRKRNADPKFYAVRSTGTPLREIDLNLTVP